MKVLGLQASVYRGASLSSRLTAQTSQLAALRRDALERWRVRPLARALGRGGGPRRRGEPGLALPLGKAARAALAKAAPAASADLDQRSHAQDRPAARRGDTSSTASKTSHPASNRSSSASTPSPIASITQGLTKHLAISPQPSTSQSSARRSPRLIWAELGHLLDRGDGNGALNIRWRASPAGGNRHHRCRWMRIGLT